MRGSRRLSKGRGGRGNRQYEDRKTEGTKREREREREREKIA